MDAASFRSMFAVIHALDRWELEDAGVLRKGAVGDSDWTRFNRDIGTYVLKLPADRLEKLVGLIESRRPKLGAPEIIPFPVFDAEDRTSEVA